MKANTISRYKWGIIAIMAIVMMLSVSLTFCLWDDNSLKSLKASGGSGDYKHVPAYKLVDDIYKDDKLTLGKNDIANVGDIVTFGKYYQDTNGSAKTDLRWIVVDSIGGTLTLLTEKVVAFGSFWDDEYYFNSSNSWVGTAHYNQRYNTSTIKEWLNSELRNDKGTGFTDSNSKKVFNGFYSEAFDSSEQSAITARTIGSMKGYYGDESNKNGNSGSPTNSYGDLPNQKVWIPSWREIYGNVNYDGNNQPVNDYSGDTQFSYFKGVAPASSNSKLVANSTPYAANSNISNYTNINATGSSNSQGGSTTSGIWWWLRSPYPDDTGYALLVNADGSGLGHYTCHSHGGVRPAVCLPL